MRCEPAVKADCGTTRGLPRGRPRCRQQSNVRLQGAGRGQSSSHQAGDPEKEQQERLLRHLLHTQRRQVLLHSLALLSRAALAPMTRAGGGNGAVASGGDDAAASSATAGATTTSGPGFVPTVGATATSRRRLGKRLRAKASQLARESLGRQLLHGLVARSLIKGGGGGSAVTRAGVPLPWLALLVNKTPSSHLSLSSSLIPLRLVAVHF